MRTHLDLDLTDYEEHPTNVENVKCFYKEYKGGYVVKCFEGRKKKPVLFKYAFDMHEVIILMETIISSKCRENIRKKEQSEANKKLKKENIEKCQIGDVYRTSWGYEQTNVNFFQVISKPTPSSVIVREISKNIVEGGFMSGHATPCVGEFVGEERKCRFNKDGTGISRIDDYNNTGRKCDPNASYYVSWGY